MKENKLVDLSADFAVKIIKLCETVKGHYSLTNQLERSSTSIGANIHEANYAHGKNDFIAKLQMSLKECYETEYWLELFVKSEISDREIAKDLYNQCGPKLSIYITLRFYNDMTYDEVARALKLPVSTVKYKTKKALIELKSLLEGDAK